MSKIKHIDSLEQPISANERFLYALAIRLDAIIEQNNSIIEFLGKTNGVAITSNEIVEEVKKPSRAKKVK